MKFERTRESYFAASRYPVVVKAKKVDAVVYMSNEGKPCAIGFSGKANKPAFHFNFRTEERRAQYVAEFFRGCEERANYRAARRAEKKTFRHTLKKGDILSNCWGYDQTNREYYEVVELVGDTMCVLRELACQVEQNGFLSESVVPVPGRYCEHAKPLRRRIQEGDRVNIYGHNYGWASLYHRPEPGKLNIMAPQTVTHTH
jgi:hypothetical protein